MTLRRVVAFAPGRVNLVGEHTDYNHGLCLPFTIERGVTVRAQRVSGADIQASSNGETDRFPVRQPQPTDGWRAFVRGVVAELQADGHSIPPAHLQITSNLPAGSGLSSSAAIEVGLTLALLALAGERNGDRLELAQMCSRVEHTWLGANTGLLDQLAALFGQPGAALEIDCRTNEVDVVPFRLDGWTVATIDSGAKRDLAASGYNERRAECARAAELLGLPSLRAATLDDADRLPDRLRRRVRHVASENARVERAVHALRKHDFDALGGVLTASHISLRDDFEVSVPAVEDAVSLAMDAGARGARIMGGGFGGAVLALFPPGLELPAGAHRVSPGPGASWREGD